ncbi:hypothetical protein GEMRC1_001411 [Eukaryota sp. GEM-RC1]
MADLETALVHSGPFIKSLTVAQIPSRYNITTLLSHLPNLTTLSISFPSYFLRSDLMLDIDPAVLEISTLLTSDECQSLSKALVSCERLQSLVLEDSEVTDEHFSIISPSLCNLSSLAFSFFSS